MYIWFEVTPSVSRRTLCSFVNLSCFMFYYRRVEVSEIGRLLSSELLSCSTWAGAGKSARSTNFSGSTLPRSEFEWVFYKSEIVTYRCRAGTGLRTQSVGSNPGADFTKR